MASYVYTYVKKSVDCQRQSSHPTYQKLLRLYRPERTLDFIEMDTLGPLPRSKTGNRFIVAITDRNEKPTTATSLKNTVTHVASIQLDAWSMPYGTSKRTLTDNRPQFVRKLFKTERVALGMQVAVTATYRLRTNGQTKRHNKTIINRLGLYASKHLNDWDEQVQDLTYA